jgi:hypothetical protein
MFESLDDEMRRDEKKASTPRERLLLYAGVVAATTLVFAGLYLSIHLLQ